MGFRRPTASNPSLSMHEESAVMHEESARSLKSHPAHIGRICLYEI